KVKSLCGCPQALYLPLIQAILQVPVIQIFLEHHVDDREKLPRCSAQCFASTLFLLLASIELHQRGPLPIDHCQHGADGDGSESLASLFRDLSVAFGPTQLTNRDGQPSIGGELFRALKPSDVPDFGQENNRCEYAEAPDLEQSSQSGQVTAAAEDLCVQLRDLPFKAVELAKDSL
ncbi:MAG TPA: hypothetical protein VGX75_01650, partial [bacterium]|nr:hypothetical protein [bacterium]